MTALGEIPRVLERYRGEARCERGYPDLHDHGYDLGYWPSELERQARMAAASDYFALGRETGNQRRSDVAMNAPVKHE